MRNQDRDEAAPDAHEEFKWTIFTTLQWTASYFASHDIESSRLSAEILLAHALGIRRIDLYLQYEKPLRADELAGFKALIRRRIKREPIAYIVGYKDFWTLTLKVDRHVLIPRPDTECLVEEALKIMDKKADSESDENQNLLKILELGTGSGAIILSLASERPGHLYFASDKSEKSLEVAKKNYTDGKIAADIRFFAGNWFDPIADANLCFDVIASNPPYIPTSDITGLAPEINRYEPALALDGGKDGLDAVRHIIGNAPSFLAPGGHLLLEIGYDQGAAVKKLAEQSGMYEDAAILKDYSRNDRVARLKIK